MATPFSNQTWKSLDDFHQPISIHMYQIADGMGVDAAIEHCVLYVSHSIYSGWLDLASATAFLASLSIIGGMESVGDMSDGCLWLMGWVRWFVWMVRMWGGWMSGWNRWDRYGESVAYVCQIMVNDEARGYWLSFPDVNFENLSFVLWPDCNLSERFTIWRAVSDDWYFGLVFRFGLDHRGCSAQLEIEFPCYFYEIMTLGLWLQKVLNFVWERIVGLV